MQMTIEWVDVNDRLPSDGRPVVVAVTGRYPINPCDDPDDPDGLSGQEYWLVLAMHFHQWHPVEDTDEVIEDCFVDFDGVLRLPFGRSRDDAVTHWAELPKLPGTDVWEIFGDGVRPALDAVGVLP